MKKYGLSFLTILILSGCVGETGVGLVPHSTTTPTKASVGLDPLYSTQLIKPLPDSPFDYMRINTTNNLMSESPTCDSNNNLCVSVVGSPSATYSMSKTPDGVREYWVQRETNVKLTLSAKDSSTIPQDLHLSNIISVANSDSSITGKVVAIDSAECDKAIASGQLMKCDINFYYEGLAFNTSPNMIYFKFTSQQTPTANVEVKVSARNSTIGVQNAPKLYLVGEEKSEIFSIVDSAQEYEFNDKLSLRYPTTFYDQVKLQNIGDAPLIYDSSKVSTGTIYPALVSSTAFGNNIADAFNLDGNATTSCASGDVAQGSNCYFRITLKPKREDISYIGRFKFSYSSGTAGIPALSKRFIVSSGEMLFDQTQINSDNPIINVKKSIIADKGPDQISYSNQISNVSFKLVYNPGFWIGTSLSGNGSELHYGFGEQDNKTIAEIINKHIQIERDPDDQSCLEDGYSLNNTNIPGTGYTTCKLRVALDQVAKQWMQKSAQPLSFLLYINYYTPVENRTISQLTELVTIDPSN